MSLHWICILLYYEVHVLSYVDLKDPTHWCCLTVRHPGSGESCQSYSISCLHCLCVNLFRLLTWFPSLSVWGGVWPVFPKCHAVLQLLCQSDCGPAEENPQQRPVSVYNPALTLLLLASPERRSNALTGTNSHSDFKEYCWHPETFPGNQYPSAELILFSHYIAE